MSDALSSPTYGSGDFDHVPGRLADRAAARLPARLAHADVWGTGQRDGFSSERGHSVAVVDLPSKVLSLTLGGLEPLQSTRRHRHNYETILYILDGEGATVVEDREIAWKAGDAVYVPVWAWHHHRNLSPDRPARYVACENAPLLQNLGELALREEAP